MVKPRAMEGTGFLGQAADDVYRIEGQDLYLVGTSEVPMAAYHSDEILDGAALPLRYAAFSPCFRKEAGSHGKDTKGIIRVHWFDKVEMFVYTTLEESVRRAPAAARAGRSSSSTSSSWPTRSSTSPPATSGCRRSGSSTARRGSRPRASTASSPRPRTAPSSRPAASTPAAAFTTGERAAGRHAQRHALRDDPHDRGDPRDPPAGGRLGPGAEGAAAVAAGPRGPGAGRCREAGWRPARGRPRHRRHPAEVGRGRRDDPRGDRAGRARRRAAGRSTPARTSCWPAAARRTA